MSLKPNSTTILSMTSFGQFSRLGDMIQKGVNYKTEAKVKLSASTRAVQKKKKKKFKFVDPIRRTGQKYRDYRAYRL
jgi:hypothetical protein